MSRKTRKLMWSVPLIAAVAVIGTLAAFGALGLGNVFANELPDNPQNLKVTAASGNAGRTTLVLNWQAPASGAPDMYRIDVSKDNEKFTFLTEVSGTTLLHSHVVRPRGMDRDDVDGKERFYRVYAMNFHGYGSVSTAESAFTKPLAVPGEVTKVKGSSNDPEIVNLSWVAPDDGGSVIWGYCILAIGPGVAEQAAADAEVTDANCLDRFRSEGAGKGNAGAADDTGTVIRILPATSYVHTDLRAEQGWTYQVYAFNRYGNSKTTTAELTIETAEADDPTPPGNLFALQSGPRTVQLYWTAPDDGGQDITSYRVEVSDTSGKWPSSSFTPVGIAAGVGSKDSEQPMTDDPAREGALFAAISLDVDTQTSVMAYQIQHTLPSGAGVGTYYYQVKTITGPTGSEKMSAFTEIKLKVVDQNDDDADIQFEPPIPAPDVYADGTGRGSQDTQSDNESTPEDDLKPGVIKLTVNQPTVAEVPVKGANSYRVDVSEDLGATWTTVHLATKPINDDEYEHKGLKPEEGLHFRLFAKRGSDYGLASAPVQDFAGDTDRPTKVRTLEATKQGAGSIKLSWVAPEDDGGADVEQYCILVNELDKDDDPLGAHVTRDGDIVTAEDETEAVVNCSRLGEPANMPIIVKENDVFQVDADTTMATFSGLAQESRWQFEVFALNNASDLNPDNTGPDLDDGRHGVSETSDKFSATTDAADVPGVPQRLTVQLALDNNVAGVGEQGVLLLWNSPANPPGAPVQSYKIERSIDGEDYTVRVSSHTSDTTHWADSQEPPEGEVWTYRVTAINDVGPGTEMAMVTIPLAEHATHTTTPAVDELTVPSDVVVSSFANTQSVSVTWDTTSIQNAEQIKVVLFNSDVTALAQITMPLITINPANDAGSATFNDVPDGTYYVTVASFRTGERHKLSSLQEVTVE